MSQNENSKRRLKSIEKGHALKERKTGKSWFLGIGIDTYVSFPILKNAVKDLDDVLALLIDRYDIDQDCVIILKNEDATREGIIDQLDQLADKLREDDKLMIYYSGHGHLDRRGVGYWVPYDAKKGRTAKLLRNSTIRDFIKIINTRHTLLISDACFSGSLFVRGVSRADAALDELEQRKSRWALCSGRHDEEVYDGEPGKNSPFAESIIEILKVNRTRRMNVAKLVDKVMELTSAGAEQVPEGNPLKGVGHKGGQYVFHLKDKEEEEWQACLISLSIQRIESFLKTYPQSKYATEAKLKIAVLQENEAWEQAQEKNSILGYQQYIKNYPRGHYQRQAREALMKVEEELDWRRALRRNKVSGYQKYLDDYEQGQYREQAQNRIEIILEEQQEPEHWAAAQRRDREEDYLSYLERYPQGRFKKEADSRIAELRRIEEEREKKIQEQEAFEKTKAGGTLQDYLDFKKAYPDSSMDRQVQEEIEKLKRADLEESQAWLKAEKADQVSLYEEYLEKYPDGRFHEKAKLALKVSRERQQARAAWQRAIATDQIHSYEEYIKRFPKGESVEKAMTRIASIRKVQEEKDREDARQKRLEAAWLKAQEEHTEAAYRGFIQENPNSPYQKAARDAIKEARLERIAEEKAWDDANQIKVLTAYRNFIKMYPKGIYRKEADAKIKELARREEEYKWQSAVAVDRPDAYESYLDQYPEGIFREKAQERMQFLLKHSKSAAEKSKDEEKAWGQATSDNTESAYLGFLFRYPNSKFASEARERLLSIQNELLLENDSYRDPRDGQVYRTQEFAGKIWMVDNLNYDVGEGCWVYRSSSSTSPGTGKDQITTKLGRLYTSAAAQEACPPGWRLPTDEEWEKLAESFGGYYDLETSKEIGNSNASYEALIVGGRSGFGATLGGWRTSDAVFRDLGEYGSYWTQSSKDIDECWRYFFDRHYRKLYRYYSFGIFGHSCRCIKD